MLSSILEIDEFIEAYKIAKSTICTKSILFQWEDIFDIHEYTLTSKIKIHKLFDMQFYLCNCLTDSF